MNEIFGYCGWDFGGALNNKFQRGEEVRIGRHIYTVIFLNYGGVYETSR